MAILDAIFRSGFYVGSYNLGCITLKQACLLNGHGYIRFVSSNIFIKTVDVIDPNDQSWEFTLWYSKSLPWKMSIEIVFLAKCISRLLYQGRCMITSYIIIQSDHIHMPFFISSPAFCFRTMIRSSLQDQDLRKLLREAGAG